MPASPEWPDPADILLDKARQDHYLAALVAGNSTVSDEQIGFLCQQAIEKSFKSVLSRQGIRYRRTHDLAELMDLMNDHAISFPVELEASAALAPFAAEMRYDSLPPRTKQGIGV